MKLNPAAAVILCAASCALAQTPATAPSSQPTSQPTTNPAEAAAVRTMLEQYNQAVESGNVDKIESHVHANTEVEKQAVATISKLARASSDLYQATEKKFGKQKLEEEQVTPQAFPSGFPALPLEQLDIKVEGDRATLSAKQNGQVLPLTIKKIDGDWKIDVGGMLPSDEKQLKDQSVIIDAVIEALKQTRQDVEQGKIAAADEVVVLMEHRYRKAAQAAQMKMLQQQMQDAQTQPSSGPAGEGPAGEGPAMSPSTQPTAAPAMP